MPDQTIPSIFLGFALIGTVLPGGAAATEAPTCLEAITHLGRNEEVAVWTADPDPVVGRVSDVDRDRLRLVLSVYDPKTSRFTPREVAIPEIERFEYRDGPRWLILGGALAGAIATAGANGISDGESVIYSALGTLVGAGVGWFATALVTHTKQVTCDPTPQTP